MDLLAPALAAQGAAAVTAVALARRRPVHVPAAAALLAFTTSTIVRIVLVYLVLRPARAAMPDPTAPFTSTVTLAAVALDSALVLGGAAIVPGLALALAVPKRRRLTTALVAGAWLLGSIALATAYPSPAVRGASLQRLYLGADLAGLAVSTIALVEWVRRTLAEQRSPGAEHFVAIGFVLLDLGILLVPHSPWRDGTWVSPFGRFDIIQIGIVVFFAAFAAVQGVTWRFSAR